MIKLPTTEVWTSGITNVPLGTNRSARYTFFELDTKDLDKLHFVLDVYRANLGSVYVHELLSGYHFYNFTPIDKVAHGRIVNIMKFLNPFCPLTVLRIIPNKWQNEGKYWSKGYVEGKDTKELEEFRTCIETGDYNSIKKKYEVVTYPFEECPKCNLSRRVMWSNTKRCFICLACNVQTIGRVKPKTEQEQRIKEYRF
jgi:hypothetical protein